MQITKKDVIQKLYDIEENNNVKVGRLVQKTVRNEIIPIEVIKFINKYDKSFLQIYDTYNTIYNSRNRNPLYRNLRNKNLDIEEMAIAMSSLVTKILISRSMMSEEDKEIFCKAMNIDKINNSLTTYSLTGDYSQMLNCFNDVNELLHLLYSE